MGTFRPVFDAAERLEFVRPSYANRAHNDYLEYLLEAGVAGALLVVWAMIFAVYRISVTLRRNDDRKIRVQTLFAVGSLLGLRSEEHTSELQSLMRISYAVFCL